MMDYQSLFGSVSPPGNFLGSCPIPEAKEGVLVLGTPQGSSSFISDTCQSLAENGSQLCEQLSDLGDPQSSLLLLRHCHVTKVNHLALTVYPDFFPPAACIHDRLTQKSFLQHHWLQEFV